MPSKRRRQGAQEQGGAYGQAKHTGVRNGLGQMT